MKHSLLRLSILALLLTVKMAVFGQGFWIDEIYYEVLSEVDKTVIVGHVGSNIGEVVTIPETIEYSGATYQVSEISSVSRKNIKKIILPSTIKAIGWYAFKGCVNLEAINIPNSVTSIGGEAFSGCERIESINIPNGITTIDYALFDGCRCLKSLSIPDGVTQIGIVAFRDCESLESMTIPNTVTSIRYCAFSGCKKIKKIELSNSLNEIEGAMFDGCSSLESIIIPQNVSKICGSAFRDCNSLMSVTLNNGLEVIEDGAFQNCSSLRNIILPDGLTNIGNNAFEGCVSLKSINIPPNVSSIGWYAFRDCKNLSSVDIPQNITSINEGLFSGCSNLKSISLHSGIKEIGNGAFCYCTSLESIELPKDVSIIKGFGYCINLKSITIPQGVTSIEYGAFDHCLHLESLTLPDSLTQIGGRAFRNCKSLKTINLPNGVTDIGNEAFEGCCGLETVVIPQNIKTIGKDAFANCLNLTLELLPETPLILNSSIGAVAIKVPKNSTVAYSKSKYWNDTNKIFAVEGDKRYVPLCLSVEGEEVLDMLAGAESGIEVEEGNAVELSLKGEVAKYSFIMKGSYDISDTIKTGGRYTLYPSLYFRDNMIRTFAYQTTDVNVTTSGTLVTSIDRNNIENIYSLKVSGELNGTDILTIWKMKNLRLLDMGNATIVNGGTTYYENYSTSEKTIGDYFFKDKENLLKVILPNNTEIIKRWAFQGCRRMKSILIPTSVKADNWLGSTDVFEDCDSLESTIILCPIISPWFANKKALRKVTLGETVTKISQYAFKDCINLENVVISNSVQEINSGAFQNCERLSTIDFPNGLKEIEQFLLYGCRSLKTVNLPSSITSIGFSAFDGCINMESINLPSNIHAIDGNALSNCYSLKSLIFPENTKIDYSAFSHCLLLENLVLPKTIDCFPQFPYGMSLKEIIIPDGVTTVAAGAFERCYSLKSVIIPNSVTTINHGAFYECEQITTITIPSSVTTIEDEAFKGCAKLETIYSLNPTPPIIEEKTFEVYHYKNAILNVPSEAVPIYWLHPYWENFFNVNESDVSSIETIDVDTSPNNSLILKRSDNVYTLNGVRISSASFGKGIYIKNGKKVIIK